MPLLLRKAVFWSHLVVGVTIAGVVLMMSVTGVVLTYEKQMMRWADDANWTAASQPGTTASMQEILGSAQAQNPDAELRGVYFYAGDDGPVAVTRRGAATLYLDPSTAEVRGESNAAVAGFLGSVRGWHRWFNVRGDGRGMARAVTGWGNFAFLFLILSGLYLWFPRRWAAQHFRAVLFLKRGATGKARDFNWHHVFGFWSAIPLAVVVFSGATISFPWLRSAVIDFATRNEVAASQPASGAQGDKEGDTEGDTDVPPPVRLADLDPIAAAALTRLDGWKRVYIPIPGDGASPVEARIEMGGAGQPQKRFTASYDQATGMEASFSTPDDRTTSSRLRGFFRFAHTGEYFGIVGQTVAGLVTLFSVILVWTGLALTWRRMLRSVRRRWRDELDQAEAAAPEGPSGGEVQPERGSSLAA